MPDIDQLAVAEGSHDKKQTFLGALQASLGAGTFVKLTLGKFRGDGPAQTCVVSRVTVRDKDSLRFVYRHKTNDVTQIKTVDEGVSTIGTLAGDSYLSATLFTSEKDTTLSYNKRREPQLTVAKPTFAAAAPADHNRTKQYIVDPARPYLKHLGLTLDDGRVKPSMYPKFKQICHFIEIIDDLVRQSGLQNASAMSVMDVGSGKGYLTFALYDYLTAHLAKRARVTGIEVRPELVQFCNDLAVKLKFRDLAFEAAHAGETRVAPVDLLIALHACDTATDDAIHHGIAGNAALIVTAPCCQHEIAPQLTKPLDALQGITKFGLFKQRQADLVTDAARCLLLETSGYKVKVIEFVSTEHTAKNLMIAGIRSADVDRDAARRQYEALKAMFGFKTQRLEHRLVPLKNA